MSDGRLRILYVEDNDDDVEILLIALEEADSKWKKTIRLKRVRTSQEAEELLAGSYRPHMILLDLNMPGEGGLPLLRKLKAAKKTRRIPVVILSNSANAQEIRQTYFEGAAAYLMKPTTFAGMIEVINKTIRFWWMVEFGDRTR